MEAPKSAVSPQTRAYRNESHSPRIRPQRLPVTPQKPLPAKYSERYNFVEKIFQNKGAATRNRIRFAIDLPLPPPHLNKTARHRYPPFSLQSSSGPNDSGIFSSRCVSSKFLRPGRQLIRWTRSRGTTAIRGNPPVSFAQNLRHPRNSRYP